MSATICGGAHFAQMLLVARLPLVGKDFMRENVGLLQPAAHGSFDVHSGAA